MRRLLRGTALGSLVLALAGWLIWQFLPIQPIMAVTSLSDPAKLATLGERGANARLLKVIFWLDEARRKGMPVDAVVTASQFLNRTQNPRAALVKQSLTRNLKIADELGLFTAENRDRMRRGRAPVVMKGPYSKSLIEVDHIVPFSLAREAGNELANLELMPAPLNRRKSNRVGERQLSHAQRLFDAGLLSKESLAKVRAQARVPQRR